MVCLQFVGGEEKDSAVVSDGSVGGVLQCVSERERGMNSVGVDLTTVKWG